jgi:hypothetical protein
MNEYLKAYRETSKAYYQAYNTAIETVKNGDGSDRFDFNLSMLHDAMLKAEVNLLREGRRVMSRENGFTGRHDDVIQTAFKLLTMPEYLFPESMLPLIVTLKREARKLCENVIEDYETKMVCDECGGDMEFNGSWGEDGEYITQCWECGECGHFEEIRESMIGR